MTSSKPSSADALYLARACELAARGAGSTAPNPPVGAVVVRDGGTLGEGFHHRRGDAHAEVEALADARGRGFETIGATLVVSLEPCDHAGLTPPCTNAIVGAGIARVVIGTRDPNRKTAGAGIARLRGAGLEVEIAEFPWAQRLIEPFATAIASPRPYVLLKIAASLDGYVAPNEGSFWLTGEPSRERVRELRAALDAVMVGVGTIRADDSRLSVRPPHARRRPYNRIVVCGLKPPASDARVFAPLDGYAATILIAPEGARATFADVAKTTTCIFVPGGHDGRVDLEAGLRALKDAGVSSLVCEGGPTLASALLAAGLVDRLVWFVAPLFLGGPRAVPALTPHPPLGGWRFDGLERSGDDLLLTAKLPVDV